MYADIHRAQSMRGPARHGPGGQRTRPPRKPKEDIQQKAWRLKRARTREIIAKADSTLFRRALALLGETCSHDSKKLQQRIAFSIMKKLRRESDADLVEAVMCSRTLCRYVDLVELDSVLCVVRVASEADITDAPESAHTYKLELCAPPASDINEAHLRGDALLEGLQIAPELYPLRPPGSRSWGRGWGEYAAPQAATNPRQYRADRPTPPAPAARPTKSERGTRVRKKRNEYSASDRRHEHGPPR